MRSGKNSPINSSQCTPLGGPIEMIDSPLYQLHTKQLTPANLPGAMLSMTCTVMAP